jgi:hypothetical protein
MSYRKIWEAANGPIPYDNQGRRMEIHHIDGNRRNNSLENLKLVTIQEHYNIHYFQGDWAACQSITNRMKISPEEKSKMCSELANKRIASGTHPFQDPEFIKADSIRKSATRSGKNHPMYGKKMSKATTDKMSASHRKLVEQGIHHLQQDNHRNRMREKALEELSQGIHPFLNSENRDKILNSINQQLQEKTHPFNRPTRTDPNKTLIYCNSCDRHIPKPAYNRFHKYHNNIKEN